MVEHLDPVLQAMQAQFANQAVFHEQAQKAMLDGPGSSAGPTAPATGPGSLQEALSPGGSQVAAVTRLVASSLLAQAAGSTTVATAQNDAKAAAAAHEAIRVHRMKEEKAQREAAEQTRQREAERLRCHLHKKPKEKSCKFCKKWQDFVNKGKEDMAAQREKLVSDWAPAGVQLGVEEAASEGLLEMANPKTFGLPPLLQSHIIESQHFKSLMSIDVVEQVVEEVCQFADSVEPYNVNSSTVPSALFCCLYRLFTMGLDARQLRSLIDNARSAFVRCISFLYVRFALDPGQLWSWLGEYVLDEQEFHPTKDSDWVTTVGEFVEALLSQERYYSTVLPRLPMSAKRHLEARLAQVPQFRKRTQANQRLLDVYRRSDVRVEACPEDGTWLLGTTLELDDSVPTRPKLRVLLSGGRGEATVHIGRVILADPMFSSTNGYYRPYRRSRSRSVDWARHKGKTQAELIDEQRSRDRDRAVCASGKEYARKPVGFKVACALPREMGAASHRLLEDETFVPKDRTKRRRSPSPSQQEVKKVQHSAEHQAQMQQLFEKYVMQRPVEANSAHHLASNLLTQGERPDVMRLG